MASSLLHHTIGMPEDLAEPPSKLESPTQSSTTAAFVPLLFASMKSEPSVSIHHTPWGPVSTEAKALVSANRLFASPRSTEERRLSLVGDWDGPALVCVQLQSTSRVRSAP